MKTAPLQKIRVITFDVFGTLVAPNPSIGHVYARCLKRHLPEAGTRELPADLNARFPAAWKQVLAATTEPVSEKSAKVFWEKVVAATLGEACPRSCFGTVFEEAWRAFGRGENWRVLPGTRRALEALRFLDYRMAAFTNADARMRTVLSDLQLDGYFERVFTSTELGLAKPDAAAFLRVAEQMGVAPADLLHVGDSLRDDVEGARGAGCRAAWLAPEAHFKPAGAVVVKSLPELVEMLRQSDTAHLQRRPGRRVVRNMVANLRGLPEEAPGVPFYKIPKDAYQPAPDDAREPPGESARASRRVRANPEQIFGDVILEVAKTVRTKATPLEALRAAWPELIGPLAERCEPVRIDAGGVLVVHCENAIIRSELGFRSRAVLRAAQKNPACNHVTRLVLQI